MSKKLIVGILLVAIGAFLIYWSVDHSPYAPVTEKITDIFQDEAYRLSEVEYYAALIIGTIIALLGLRNILK